MCISQLKGFCRNGFRASRKSYCALQKAKIIRGAYFSHSQAKARKRENYAPQKFGTIRYLFLRYCILIISSYDKSAEVDGHVMANRKTVFKVNSFSGRASDRPQNFK